MLTTRTPCTSGAKCLRRIQRQNVRRRRRIAAETRWDLISLLTFFFNLCTRDAVNQKDPSLFYDNDNRNPRQCDWFDPELVHLTTGNRFEGSLTRVYSSSISIRDFHTVYELLDTGLWSIGSQLCHSCRRLPFCHPSTLNVVIVRIPRSPPSHLSWCKN